MNKYSIVVILAIAATASLYFYNEEKSDQISFEGWISKFSHVLHIKPEEMIYRSKIFEKNVKKINDHNSLQGKTYKLGINQFTAFTQEQFAAMYLTHIEPSKKEVKNKEDDVAQPKISIDWDTYGAVSPVKNQGSCTASYAFSAIGAIEGLSVIYFKTTQEYSVQQVIDCSFAYGNSGCNTGNMVNSFQYIYAKGINTWASYPYRGVVGSCQANSGFFKINGYYTISSCAALDNALTGRPISVAVDGTNFPFYSSGIFDNCGTNLSLAGLLVGVTDLYYRFKNSWGTSWGEQGYIRLLKSGNICGICSAGSYPVA